MKKLSYVVSILFFLGSTLVLSTCKDEPDKPSIKSLSPDTGKEGDVITIAGSFLGSAKKVKFGSVDALVIDPKGGEVTTQVPVNAPLGSVSVTVETAAGTSNALNFTVVLPPPEITSIDPAEGGSGLSIKIIGKHLETASLVTFGDKTAVPDSKAATQVIVKVPDGLALGAIDVTVTSDGGTSDKATFTIISKPTITEFTPPAGPAGTHVFITGTNFEDVTGVFFLDATAAFEIKTATLIDAVVPAMAPSGKIKVVAPGGEGVSPTEFIAKGAPVVTSFLPASGFAGAVITVTGQNLNVPGILVKFGGTAAVTVTITSDTEVKATVPASATTGKITIETIAGTGTSATDFTVIGPPTISSFAPLTAAIGASVTINGTNFIDVSKVTFSTTEVAAGNFTVDSPTKITAKVPAGAANGLISVTNTAGTGSSPASFTITGAPTISSFTPTSGPTGTSVVINGADFVNVAAVKFNGIAVDVANYTVNAANKITAKVPNAATDGVISVTNAVGTGSSSSSFAVIGVPTITIFSPTSGPVGGTVIITGTSFTQVSSVKFNGVSAVTYTVNSLTQITATVPAGATTGKISITTVAGTVTSAQNFTVAGPPTVTSFSPTTGPAGASIGITGTNFVNVSSVKFNSTEVGAANYTVNSLTSITAKVPAGATNGVISVTTPSGLGSSSASFVVIPQPTISAFTPGTGPIGQSVIITGTSFTSATAVKFNNVTAVFTINSATQITATVPAAATTGAISVTNPAGTANSANSFTVILAPLISSISPTAGPAGTTTLTITGTNLSNATQVKFNTTVVASLISNTATQIQVTIPGSLGAGAVNVSVVTAGGTSNTKTFTVTIPPTITDLKPNVSYKGFPIMILGSNMKNVTTVKIGSTVATINTLYDASAIITIPNSVTNGSYQVTVSDAGGSSTGLTLNVITAPAGVGGPPSATFVSPPPADYINAVSNDWVGFHLLSQGFGSQCDIIDPSDQDNDVNYLCGTYNFAKDGTGKVISNYVEITIGTGHPATNLETFYGQWSATVPDPCTQKLVLISGKDGHIVTGTVAIDVEFGSPYPSGTCH